MCKQSSGNLCILQVIEENYRSAMAIQAARRIYWAETLSRWVLIHKYLVLPSTCSGVKAAWVINRTLPSKVAPRYRSIREKWICSGISVLVLGGVGSFIICEQCLCRLRFLRIDLYKVTTILFHIKFFYESLFSILQCFVPCIGIFLIKKQTNLWLLCFIPAVIKCQVSKVEL